jgi:hypothetical protein
MTGFLLTQSLTKKVSHGGLFFLWYVNDGCESEPTWLHFGKDARVQSV